MMRVCPVAGSYSDVVLPGRSANGVNGSLAAAVTPAIGPANRNSTFFSASAFAVVAGAINGCSAALVALVVAPAIAALYSGEPDMPGAIFRISSTATGLRRP